jgi:ribonuclease VapC
VTSVVLDASALLAMIKDEPGGDRVAEVVTGARISAINYAEVVSHFDFHGTPAGEIGAMLHPLPVEVVAADRELATLAGTLRAATAAAGLSLGDRFCLAQALTDGLPAWTADRGWADIAAKVGVDVVVIR